MLCAGAFVLVDDTTRPPRKSKKPLPTSFLSPPIINETLVWLTRVIPVSVSNCLKNKTDFHVHAIDANQIWLMWHSYFTNCCPEFFLGGGRRGDVILFPSSFFFDELLLVSPVSSVDLLKREDTAFWLLLDTSHWLLLLKFSISKFD